MKLVNDWYFPDAEINPTTLANINLPKNYSHLDECYLYVKNFNCAIDIGAWIGDTTVHMAKRFQGVLAFEALQNNYDCLIENLKYKNITNVGANHAAVSNIDGIVNISVNATNSAWVNTKSNLGEAVKSIKLDSLVVPRIDFIKIDVDSHEGYLLEGAANFFSVHRPIICIEVKESVQKRQHVDMPNPHKLLELYNYKLVKKVSHIDYLYVSN